MKVSSSTSFLKISTLASRAPAGTLTVASTATLPLAGSPSTLMMRARKGRSLPLTLIWSSPITLPWAS